MIGTTLMNFHAEISTEMAVMIVALELTTLVMMVLTTTEMGFAIT